MVYQNDIGLIILVNTNIDLTGSVITEFKVQKPDLTEVTWDASVPSGMAESDGYLQYQTVAGDLDQVGDYKIHAHRTAADIDQLGGVFTLKVKAPWT